MTTGKIICIVICIVVSVIVGISTILKIIYRHSPIYETRVFAVYRNFSGLAYGITSYPYRCVLTRQARRRIGNLNIISVGETIEEAIDNAKLQLQGQLKIRLNNKSG